jgi:uncharacterized protein (DUF58 family)
MLRSLLLSAITLIFLLIASWDLSGDMLIMILPGLIFLAVAYIGYPSDIRLRVNRIIDSKRLIQETEFNVRVRITNLGSSVDEIYLEDVFPKRFKLVKGDNRVLCPLAAGETIEWEYSLQSCLGEYSFTGVNATVHNLLGLVRKKMFIEEKSFVTVTPKSLPIKKAIIRPRRTQVYTGTIPTRSGGIGIDYFGMREYMAGDSPRLINWKALARHQDQLYTNQFERECMAAVGLVFDCRKSSYAVGDRRLFLDQIAPAAVEFTNTLLRDGNRVGLLVFGATLDWTFIGAGKAHRERIARAISKIELKEHEKFESLGRIPTRLFPSQSQIIFFSPLKKNDYKPLIELQARGYQIIVISPNPILFDKGLIEYEPSHSMAERILSLERELLLRKIRQSGIQVIDWDLSVPFYQIVSHHLNRQTGRNLNLVRAI